MAPLGTLDAAFDLIEVTHSNQRPYLLQKYVDDYVQENILLKTAEKKIMFLQSVIASTFIPIFSGIFPCRIRGVPVIDGGFSVNQVVLNEGTVTVSPFAGDAHICPQDDVLDSDMITRVSVNYRGNIGSIDQELLSSWAQESEQ